MRSNFYNKADGALLVFDLTNKKTFENLDSWLTETKNGVGSDIPMFILGNKMDLSDIISVQDQEVAGFANQHNWQWAKSSAKTGENVEQAFVSIASVVMK